jgi:putative CRISPR-associated protein (TIGR02619 family)
MATPKFVLTTVGISLLLNSLEREEEEWRRQLNQEANSQALPLEVKQKVAALSSKALGVLRRENIEQSRRLSAELNGLYALYDNQLEQARGDMHYLIATDTVQGAIAAETVKGFLQTYKISVDIYTPPRLSTAEPQAFSTGIKNLMHWCEKIIPNYRQKGYQIIFNLTAAFKSLQGYLNIVGMFYADRIVYIFETGSQLLSIPRLPVHVDIESLRKHRTELALMAQGYISTAEQMQGVPEGLLEIDEKGNASLSDWGQLIWNQVRVQLLGEDLLPFPRLLYADSFRRDFRQANAAERTELQEALAKVAGLLEDHKGDTARLKQDGGLRYDVFTRKKTEDGHPIGHFRVSQNRRISCTAEGGLLRLRHYGEHDVVNNNP